jgi:putative transposase
LASLIKSAHSFTARRWNTADGQLGRQVWFQYWDTCLASIGSFFARLNYIHHNPEKHGYVAAPEPYPWSSYAVWQSYGVDVLTDVEAAYPWDRLNLE